MRGICALLIAGWIGLQANILRAEDFQPHAIGTVLRDAIELGNGVKAPLPDGEWRVVANTVEKPEGSNQSGRRYYKPVLAELKGKTIARYIVISNSLEGPQRTGFSGAFTFNSACRNPLWHYKKEFANYDGGYQDCWWMRNAGANLTAKAGPEYYASWDYFTKNKIPIPLRTMQVTFHFATPQGKYLDVSVYHNPEVAGFKSTTWNRDEILLDGPKQDYLAKLIGWGETWHDRVKEGFEGKLKAEQKIVPPAVAKVEPKSAPSQSAAVPPSKSANAVQGKTSAEKMPTQTDFPKAGSVSTILDGGVIKENLKKYVVTYLEKKSGAKVLVISEDGQWMSWSAKEAGRESLAIEDALSRCQTGSKTKCHVIAIADDLAVAADSIKARKFN